MNAIDPRATAVTRARYDRNARLYDLMTCGSERLLLENVLAAVQRDPGVRVLVTVDCRRWHQLAKQLRHVKEIELVAYWEL